VPLIHQHEVTPLERLGGDGRLAVVVLELVDRKNLDRPPGLLGEEAIDSLFSNRHDLEPRLLELRCVLRAQSVVGRDEDDLVEPRPRPCGIRRRVILSELPNMHMHQQRLPAARCAPECQARQLTAWIGIVIPGGFNQERRDMVRLGGLRVVLRDSRIDFITEQARVLKVPIKEHLREKQCQVLVVFPVDARLIVAQARRIDRLRVLQDVLLVDTETIDGHNVSVRDRRHDARDCLEEPVQPGAFIDPFRAVRRNLKPILELLQVRDAEFRERPLEQDRLSVKIGARRRAARAA